MVQNKLSLVALTAVQTNMSLVFRQKSAEKRMQSELVVVSYVCNWKFVYISFGLPELLQAERKTQNMEKNQVKRFPQWKS